MTDYYEPMKAKRVDTLFLTSINNDTRWAAGEKFDGYREQLHLLNTGNQLWSSGGNSHIDCVPQFKVIVPELDDTILDCEGLSPTRRIEDNATCFKSSDALRWQDEHGMAFLVVFDILRYKGEDCMHLPFFKRRVLLEVAFKVMSRYCMWNTQLRLENLIMTHKLEYYYSIITRTKEEGHEGVMLKDMNASYTPGKRGPAWYKAKRTEVVVARITGFLPSASTDKYAGMVGSVTYGYQNCEGSASGLNDDLRRDMTDHPDKYIGKLAYFECQEITDMGVMRHPSYIRELTTEEVKKCKS